MVRNLFLAVVVIAAFSFLAQPVSAQGYLFQQYTTQGASSATADLYTAPHRVPSHVGASYYTYQPLQPHEMLYEHSRNYYNYQGNGHLNKTTVIWQNGANHMGPLPFSGWPAANLKYKWNAYRYCLESGGTNCGAKFGFGGGGAGGHFGGQNLRGHLRSKFQNHFGALGGGCASGQCAASADLYGSGGYVSEPSFGGGFIDAAPAAGGCQSGGCGLLSTAPVQSNAKVATSVLENRPVTANLSDESISR